MAIREALAGAIALFTVLFTRRKAKAVTLPYEPVPPPLHPPLQAPAPPPSIAPVPWPMPERGLKWAADIYAAEDRNEIPRSLLARLLWEESRFRSDIISGETISSAGAIGIAQIVPRWHPTARPLDPVHSIYYAADYLATLHRQFGTWPLALAAYNWGPGNLKKFGFDRAPFETRDYVAQITGDVSVA